MRRFAGIRRTFRPDTGRPPVEQLVDDELRFHFEMTMDELKARGLSDDAARAEAQRRFGDVEITRQRLRHIDREQAGQRRRADWLGAVAQDARYAMRQLRAAPGFAAVVVLTIALGIGANVTMFGIVDRLLLRPPAHLVAPERTGRIYMTRVVNDEDFTNRFTGYRRFAEFRDNTRAFEELAAFTHSQRVLGEGDAARRLPTGSVSASYFRFFDVRPALGRFFLPEEDRVPSGAAVVVVGHAYWQAELGGDPAVLGKTIRIDNAPYTIVGVAPEGFNGFSPTRVAAFVPITTIGYASFGNMYHETHNISWMEIAGRLKPGVTREAAGADLTRAYRASMAAAPNARPLEVSRPRAQFASIIVERGPMQGQESKVATWLVGVSVLVLLIACANVANLLLARALRRRREIAVRIALGVGRARLAGQLLTESLVLAGLGAAAGLLVAHWGGGILRTTFMPDADWRGSIVDPRLLLVALAGALVVGVLAGVAPVLQARRPDVTDSLKAGVREGGLHRSRLRTLLLVVQGALSVVLLVGAGLFVRSLQNVRAIDLGYDADRLIYASTERFGNDPTAEPARRAAALRMLDAARRVPGVESAALNNSVPYWATWSSTIRVPGLDTARLDRMDVSFAAISPEYFATAGTRIVRGRGFAATDAAGAPMVVVVSQSLANALWPGEEPVGKCLQADTLVCRTVVGVAHDLRRTLEEQTSYQLYLPWTQAGRGSPGMYVRVADPDASIEAVRRAIQRAAPSGQFVNASTLSDILDPSRRSWTLGATMFVAFGGLALLVAMVGLYSVLAYTVAQRTHEMGVRVALGARQGDVIALVVRDGIRVAVAGLAIGLAVAWLGSRALAPLLYEVSPHDPLTYALVAGVLLVVAVAASWIPARRASRVAPAVALRAD